MFRAEDVAAHRPPWIPVPIPKTNPERVPSTLSRFPALPASPGAVARVLNAYSPYMRTVANDEQAMRLWEGMLAAVLRHRVGQRPHRIKPSAVKRRPKN